MSQQTPERVVRSNDAFNLNRRRVLQGITATSMVGLGGLHTVLPVQASEHDGCACMDTGCRVEVDLCAGQDEDVGYVQIQAIDTGDGYAFDVQYVLDEGYELDETHLYVGKTCPEELSSAPGQFPFSETYESGVSSAQYAIDFADVCEWELTGGGNRDRSRGNGGKWENAGNCGVQLGDCVYVAAHAVVVKRNEEGEVTWEETAWGDGCEGTEITDGGNWATYFSYTASLCTIDFPATVFAGYEDLPIGGVEGGDPNDYDYNDFLVRLDTEFTATQTNGETDVSEIRFDITPRARGANFAHAFHLLFPAGTICAGEYELTVYDENDNPVVGPTTQQFDGTSDVDVTVFDDTSDIFGNKTNTVQGDPCETPDRTAELTVTFDDPCPIDLAALDPDKPHGSGLFFDPYIMVLDTGEQIGSGDIRLLTVPDTWLWPQEKAAIWNVYDEVDDDGTGQPVFTTDDWYDGGYDSTLVYTGCQ